MEYVSGYVTILRAFPSLPEGASEIFKRFQAESLLILTEDQTVKNHVPSLGNMAFGIPFAFVIDSLFDEADVSVPYGCRSTASAGGR